MLPALRMMNNSPGSVCSQQAGIDPRVGAGDEQRQRMLPVDEPLEQPLLGTEDVRLKLMNAFNKLLHCHYLSHAGV